ncbi:MAG: hypothetical protein QM751_06020 [Paludibacteraceae bacterium]
MRKRLSILFLALGTVMLLASGVMPHHHHHNGAICMAMESNEDNNAQAGEQTKHATDHHSSEKGNCVAENDFTTPNTDGKVKIKILNTTNRNELEHTYFVTLLYFVASLAIHFLCDEHITSEFGVYISFYPSIQANSCHSLRAPPFLFS